MGFPLFGSIRPTSDWSDWSERLQRRVPPPDKSRRVGLIGLPLHEADWRRSQTAATILFPVGFDSLEQVVLGGVEDDLVFVDALDQFAGKESLRGLSPEDGQF